MNKKLTIAISTLGVILVGIIVWLCLWIISTREDLAFLSEQYAIEKEEMIDQYTQTLIEYEGYKLQVNNDSLEQKLEDQRVKIQQLVEELRQTKKEDARKIAALKKELETVRGVLRYYVAQVDSLNQINDQLKAENQEVRQQMRAVSNTNADLTQQNEALSRKVDIASHLKTRNLTVEAQNKRGKSTDRLKYLTLFVVSFNIDANVTAETGNKDIFVRILKPNEELLTNSKSGTFQYENSNIEFSMKKTIAYTGEETPVTLYWNRNETLDPGTYVFEVYGDGKLMGKTSIIMDK